MTTPTTTTTSTMTTTMTTPTTQTTETAVTAATTAATTARLRLLRRLRRLRRRQRPPLRQPPPLPLPLPPPLRSTDDDTTATATTTTTTTTTSSQTSTTTDARSVTGRAREPIGRSAGQLPPPDAVILARPPAPHQVVKASTAPVERSGHAAQLGHARAANMRGAHTRAWPVRLRPVALCIES